jgi:hypothetical protein
MGKVGNHFFYIEYKSYRFEVNGIQGMGNTPGGINERRHLAVDLFLDDFISLCIKVVEPQGKDIEPVSNIVMDHYGYSLSFFFLGFDIFKHKFFLMKNLSFMLNIFFFDNPADKRPVG